MGFSLRPVRQGILAREASGAQAPSFAHQRPRRVFRHSRDRHRELPQRLDRSGWVQPLPGRTLDSRQGDERGRIGQRREGPRRAATRVLDHRDQRRPFPHRRRPPVVETRCDRAQHRRVHLRIAMGLRPRGAEQGTRQRGRRIRNGAARRRVRRLRSEGWNRERRHIAGADMSRGGGTRAEAVSRLRRSSNAQVASVSSTRPIPRTGCFTFASRNRPRSPNAASRPPPQSTGERPHPGGSNCAASLPGLCHSN